MCITSANKVTNAALTVLTFSTQGWPIAIANNRQFPLLGSYRRVKIQQSALLLSITYQRLPVEVSLLTADSLRQLEYNCLTAMKIC